MKISNKLSLLALSCLAMTLNSCSDDDNISNISRGDAEYVGKAVGNFDESEWFPGGKLGTTDNVVAGCYEDESPAVNEQGLLTEFNTGEYFFERNFNLNTQPFNG